MNILKIDSSPRSEASDSRKLSALLVQRMVAQNPSASVQTRDLKDAPPAVSELLIQSSHTPKAERSAEQLQELALSDELLTELKAADVLVFSMPIYNFGMPAALKAWVDQICRVNETFVYGPKGPQGLLSNKRAFIAVTSGGVPLGSPVDFASPHLRQILNFIGIDDVTIFGATGLASDPTTPMENAIGWIDEQTF